jgi:hypothetical protein
VGLLVDPGDKVYQALLERRNILRAEVDAASQAMDLTNRILVERVDDVSANRPIEHPMLHYLDANDLAAELWLRARKQLGDFSQQYPEIR